jgi:hypothetical protein
VKDPTIDGLSEQLEDLVDAGRLAMGVSENGEEVFWERTSVKAKKYENSHS